MNKELLESLRIMIGLVRVKYGNLDPAVYREIGKAEALIKAHARLIAAAPDLLEACKHAAMEWRLHGQLTDSCRILEAAIKQGEGE